MQLLPGPGAGNLLRKHGHVWRKGVCEGDTHLTRGHKLTKCGEFKNVLSPNRTYQLKERPTVLESLHGYAFSLGIPVFQGLAYSMTSRINP